MTRCELFNTPACLALASSQPRLVLLFFSSRRPRGLLFKQVQKGLLGGEKKNAFVTPGVVGSAIDFNFLQHVFVVDLASFDFVLVLETFFFSRIHPAKKSEQVKTFLLGVLFVTL